MTNGDAQEPLRELERRIEGAKRALDAGTKDRAAREGPQPFGSALAMAWRIGLELVVAIAVSTALGWGIDRWFGTRPWGMIVMFFLGIAAGMVNVWRAVAGMGMAMGYRRDETKTNRLDDDED